MTFKQLVSLYEAKGTKPGQRFHSVQKSKGPASTVSSPIAREDNFELFKDENPLPKDKGLNDVTSIIGLLSKGLSLLKNDDVFADQMKGIMNGFKKNRNQISAYQESVLKSKPKTIDNLWGTINRLTKIVNDPKKQQEADHDKWVAELNDAIQLKDKHQAELDDVYDQIDNVTENNEDLNNEYLEQLLTAIKHTTSRLFRKLTQEIQEENPGEKPIAMHELDWNQLEKSLNKSSQAQLQLLEMLMNEDSDKNPLISFLQLQENNYNEARDRYFQLRRGDNYSITTDQLYRNLPLFAFTNFFANTILKSPPIKLTTKQSKTADKAKDGDDMLSKLGNIKNEREFEEIRPELVQYIDSQPISDDQKNSLRALANGKFVTRKGTPNAAFKIRSSLKSSQLSESFDSFAGSVLIKTGVDQDDFALDLIEIFYK